MELLQRTLDIEDEAGLLADRMADIEAGIEALVDEAETISPPTTDEAEARLDVLREEVAEKEARLAEVRGYRAALQRAVDEWDGSEVHLRELSGAETRAIRAEAQQQANTVGVDYTDDFHETKLLERATVSTPPGAPAPEDIGDLPNRLFDWLVTRANLLNSMGEFEMGNSSLRERLAAREQTSSE